MLGGERRCGGRQVTVVSGGTIAQRSQMKKRVRCKSVE